MSLLFETITIAVLMMVFCALPLFSPSARKYSKHLFLLGTGAMFGICFFDLLPDVFEMGGSSSLYIMGGVWLLYSIAHLFHLHHHDHEEFGHVHGAHSATGITFFLGSLVAHCFASGMLLTVSFGLSKKIAGTVFAALLAHKIYESLLLSSILLERKNSRLWKGTVIGLYGAALPAGAGLTAIFQGNINERIAILISSIAVGTLLGCLIFDFLLPSFAQLKQQRYKVGWILAGLLLTQLIMRQL
jgi:zinc transporter ZupT